MGYALDQSALYHLTTRPKLAVALKISKDELLRVCKDPRYSDREIVAKNGKRRRIQEPQGILRKIHKRVAILLSRIEGARFPVLSRQKTFLCFKCRTASRRERSTHTRHTVLFSIYAAKASGLVLSLCDAMRAGCRSNIIIASDS